MHNMGCLKKKKVWYLDWIRPRLLEEKNAGSANSHMWEKMFSFSQRNSSCTKRKESVSMQNFPTVCKTLFLALFTWFLSLQVYVVRLHTPQSLTIVEIPPLWILKSSSPFITATKAVPWTLWLRIYTVYIQGDTPTAAGFFVLLPFRLALLSGQTGKLHKLLFFFLCTGTFYTVPSRAASGRLSVFVQCERWMYCCSGCMSAHLHIPQALSHSFSS